MSLKALKNIPILLQSDKIKERQEGLDHVRAFFSKPKNVAAFQEDSGNMLKTFQTLFSTVVTERGLYSKKGSSAQSSSAISRRLTECASTLRSVVENTVTILPRKVIKALLAHLLQMLVFSRALFQPVALDYLKALKTVISYRPHLEWLDASQWIDTVNLCLSGALGDEIQLGSELSEKDDVEGDEMDIDEDDSLPGPSSRRRAPTQRTQRTGTPFFGTQTPLGSSLRSASQENNELMSCLVILFQSPSALLIQFGQVLLSKLARFFRSFSSETTAHLPALEALNLIAAELDLNNKAAMIEGAQGIVPSILKLWTTKSHQVKEQLVISLRYLFPFLAQQGEGEGESDPQEILPNLLEAVLSETEIRWRTESLDLDCLQMNCTSRNGSSRQSTGFVFESRSFKYGNGFTGGQALAWATMELGADCLHKLYVMSDTVSPTQFLNPEGRVKRRKIEDPITSLLASLRPEGMVAHTVHRLQLFVFLIERHWDEIHDDLRLHCLRVLSELLSAEDHNIQNWVFLALTSIASSGALPERLAESQSSPSKSRRKPEVVASPWDQIWAFSTRRISIAEVCRMASLLTFALADRGLVTQDQIVQGVEAVVDGLDVQGPSFPFDSVCALLGFAIDTAARDVRLYRRQIPYKVFAWLSTSWRPLESGSKRTSNKAKVESLDVRASLLLLAKICLFDKLPELRCSVGLPDSPISAAVVSQNETADMRNFMLHAKLPPYQLDAVRDDQPAPTKTATLEISQPTMLQRKVSSFFLKAFEGWSARDEDMDWKQTWSGFTLEKARSVVDFAILAICFQASLQWNGIKGDRNALLAACKVVGHFGPLFSPSRWTPAQLGSLLDALDPVLVTIAAEGTSHYPAVLNPGQGSGIRRERLPRRMLPSVRLHQRDELLKVIWTGADVQDAFGALFKEFKRAFGETSHVEAIDTENFEPATHDDGFRETRSIASSEASYANTGLTGSGRSIAGLSRLDICIRAILTVAFFQSKPSHAIRVPEIMSALLEEDAGQLLRLGPPVFDAVSAGILELAPSDAGDLLVRFGNGILDSYHFSRSEPMVMLVIRFLESNVKTWTSGEHPEFTKRAVEMCSWLTLQHYRKKVSSWRVRLRYVAFLDTFLALDPSQESWADDDSASVSDGTIIKPSTVLPTMLNDQDFRVRFRVSTSACQLFEFLAEDETRVLWQDIGAHMPADADKFESILTRILCNGNAVISSALARRAPYYDLLSIGMTKDSYVQHVEAMLRAVATRLGLAHMTNLYGIFANHVTRRQLTEGQENIRIPERICGYQSRRDFVSGAFGQTGWALVVANRMDLFESQCTLLNKQLQAGIRECFPLAAAEMIQGAFAESTPSVEDGGIGRLHNGMLELAKASDLCGRASPVDFLRSVSDQVAVALLSWLYESNPTPLEPIFDSFDNEKGRATLEGVFADAPIIPMVEPAEPLANSSMIVAGLSWFSDEYHVFDEPASVYSVLQQIITSVQRAAFLSDQIRLVYATGLAIAMTGKCIASPGILKVLMQGFVALLQIPDLFLLVKPMFQWSVSQYLALPQPGSKANSVSSFSHVLIAAGNCAYAHSRRGEVDLVGAGESLLTWVEDCLASMRSVSVHPQQKASIQAALFWPRALVESSEAQLTEINEICEQSDFTDSKFSLVVPLHRALVHRHGVDVHSPLWQILSSQPTDRKPSLRECDALVEVLAICNGEVEPPSLAEKVTGSSNRGHVRTFFVDRDIKMAAVIALAGYLRDDSFVIVDLAARTLRKIFTIVDLDEAATKDACSIDDKRELVLLAAPELQGPLDTRSAPLQTLDVLDGDEWTALGRTHKAWISRFTSLLADYRSQDGERFYAQLHPMIEVCETYSVRVLPLLVHSLLLQGHLSDQTGSRQLLSRYFIRLLGDDSTDTATVKRIIEVVTYLRKHPPPSVDHKSQPLPSSSDSWLTISWVLLSRGAVRCSLYPAALLFLELAHEYNGFFIDLPEVPDSTAQASTPEEDEGRDLFHDIYSNLDDPDGFHGIQSKDLREKLLHSYRHEQKWDRALEIHGAEYELGIAATSGVVGAMASSGLYRLAMATLQMTKQDGILTQQGDHLTSPHELAWRTETWDLPVIPMDNASSSANLYAALRAFHRERDTNAISDALNGALYQEAKKLATISTDQPKPNLEAIRTLLCLREARWWHRHMGDVNSLEHERLKTLPPISEVLAFETAEKVLSTRISILRTIRSRARLDQIGDGLSDLSLKVAELESEQLIQLSRRARSTRPQLSLVAVTRARDIQRSLFGTPHVDIDEELASVLWVRGEHAIAIDTLRNVLKSIDQGKAAEGGNRIDNGSVIRSRLGRWIATARLENPRDLATRYFEPAIQTSSPGTHPLEAGAVFHDFAAFSDAQYENLRQSQELARLKSLRERIKADIDSLGRRKSQTISEEEKKTLAAQAKNAKGLLKEDERQIKELETDRSQFLITALRMYARALSASDGHDEDFFRFTALWLEHSADDRVNSELTQAFETLPSRKFIPLSHQLMARLTSQNGSGTEFQKNLMTIAERFCSDHPFHTIYHIFALRRTASTIPAQSQPAGTQSSRAGAVEEVLQRTMKSSKHADRIKELEQACAAYASWAEYDIKTDPEYRQRVRAKKAFRIPHKHAILRLKDMSIPVSTVAIPIDPSCEYPVNSMVCIKVYADTYSTAGGIHLPKIMECVGNDGVKYKQLFKREDDTRQDAVMQQVFGVCNQLLRNDRETSKRKLAIRTYKVIPLTPTSGLIEFVNNTLPLSKWLNDAHEMYRPGDMKVATARTKLQKATFDSPQRLEVFREILDNLKPVMRHYFFEHQKIPSRWFEMRLNYARSVASTSIIGHILGLGDRHTSNILIDSGKGEIIPIDLGIAFDSGKYLGIPERVPFRLTRDMVDGLGMTGVEGVFRKCSEHILRVLREQSDVIVTVVEVLKYDPLHTWTKRNYAQGSELSENRNSAPAAEDNVPEQAERCLSSVRGKLSNDLSVEYTVNELIQEARDFKNLACIFHGWSAYL